MAGINYRQDEEEMRHLKVKEPDAYTLLCAVCSSSDRVEYLTITDCNLCYKCQDELSKGFEEAMKMDRSDYPEL